MSNDFNSNSRSGYRAKRKKTNLVLNSLIVIVLLLIVFVAYKIFASGSDTASPKKETPVTTEKQTIRQNKQKDTLQSQKRNNKHPTTTLAQILNRASKKMITNKVMTALQQIKLTAHKLLFQMEEVLQMF